MALFTKGEELSFQMIREPEVAFKRLHRLFADHQFNTSQVARVIGVNRSTVIRWCSRLVQQGMGDPRGNLRGCSGRTPRDGRRKAKQVETRVSTNSS